VSACQPKTVNIPKITVERTHSNFVICIMFYRFYYFPFAAFLCKISDDDDIYFEHAGKVQGSVKTGSGGSTDPLKFEIGVKKLIPRLCRTGDL